MAVESTAEEVEPSPVLTKAVAVHKVASKTRKEVLVHKRPSKPTKEVPVMKSKPTKEVPVVKCKPTKEVPVVNSKPSKEAPVVNPVHNDAKEVWVDKPNPTYPTKSPELSPSETLDSNQVFTHATTRSHLADSKAEFTSEKVAFLIAVITSLLTSSLEVPCI